MAKKIVGHDHVLKPEGIKNPRLGNIPNMPDDPFSDP
jgi:hypothetical protein